MDYPRAAKGIIFVPYTIFVNMFDIFKTYLNTKAVFSPEEIDLVIFVDRF